MAEPHKLDPKDVTAAVIEGVNEGAEATGVRVNLIGILSRTYGVDLAGDEAKFPPALFMEHFRRGRDVGWRITVHAGESAGAQSVCDAIKLLGAERIGHGVRAMEDPALVDFLVEKRIGIEANLTSNVQTSTVTDLASHPLREMLARGLLASLNTDDPGVSAIDLPHEFDVAAPSAGLSRAQIRQTQINALETSFLSEEVKSTLRSKTVARSSR